MPESRRARTPDSLWQRSVALGVRLEKLNYYVLGEGLKPCAVSDIPRAICFNRIITAMLIMIVLAIMLFAGLPLSWGVFTWPPIF